jgi:alpha-ketoglutarate-dependent taurine dioxygenase
MNTLRTIEFPGYEELKNNFNTYKDIFLNEQIIAFRNANVDFETQTKIINLFGDNFNLQQNSSNTESSEYTEDHHKHMNKENVENKNEIMLDWHQEHVEDKKYIYAIGVWNMELFKCDPDAGKTYFIDMSKVYNSFTSIDKEFLNSCLVSIKNYWEIEDENENNQNAIYSLVLNHWITNEKTIRTFYGRGEKVDLYSVNGNIPTELEIDKFNLLHDEIFAKVWLDNDIKIQHRWQEGDLLIPDLFKLAHAVTGGFDKDQRRLKGIFGTIGNNN